MDLDEKKIESIPLRVHLADYVVPDSWFRMRTREELDYLNIWKQRLKAKYRLNAEAYPLWLLGRMLGPIEAQIYWQGLKAKVEISQNAKRALNWIELACSDVHKPLPVKK